MAVAWLSTPATNLLFVHDKTFCPELRHLKDYIGSRLGVNTPLNADSPCKLKYPPSKSFAASARLVTYTTIDSCAFGTSLRVSHDNSEILTLFSFFSISAEIAVLVQHGGPARVVYLDRILPVLRHARRLCRCEQHYEFAS